VLLSKLLLLLCRFLDVAAAVAAAIATVLLY
jgi:hypothetical protein